MFGFVANDLFDRGKDAAAGVRRPIATGQLAVASAVFLAIDLTVIVER
jgi:4-hydroxybenzoate polyprenyltransferase